MRNRAKCKLCGEILESFALIDYVSCKCGEIAINGGDMKYETFAKDYSNFLRVDDEGNEIVVEVKELGKIKELSNEVSKPSRSDLISILDEMIASYENLPPAAGLTHVTQNDLHATLLIISQIFKAQQG
ncbi:MAG: hypothetical protein EHM34_03480 [Nitrosopumilales archaeon]|nr:MAG: hypothetical protein EHM34_03480 [Nitrosopumilales archaeon]